jgi:kynurenine formamidase
MIITTQHSGKNYRIDLSDGIDLSSTLGKSGEEIKAWYVDEVKKEAVVGEGWIGSVKEGSPVNFYNIHFNPHGNGTHTESFGHISEGWESVNEQLTDYHCFAHFLQVKPKKLGENAVIGIESLEKIQDWDFDALIVKGGNYKPGHDFSKTNPPYFAPEFIQLIKEKGVKHFLTDLPSVDREEDEGKMSAHKTFWDFPENPRYGATISELLHIPDHVKEGLYFMNLQLAPFHNDASPSRPVLYSLQEI